MTKIKIQKYSTKIHARERNTMPSISSDTEPKLFTLGELLAISKYPFQKKGSDDGNESTEPEDNKTSDLVHIIWDQNNMRAF